MSESGTCVCMAALALVVLAAGCTSATGVRADGGARGAGSALVGEAASLVPTDRAADQAWAEEPALGPAPGTPANAETSEAAVRGYLQAAYTVEASDGAIRHRRHHPWLHPAAPGRTGGIWTPVPPPDGVIRRVEVLDLELVASAGHGDAWEVVYRLWDGPNLHTERTGHVTTRQEGGTWLVFAETVDLQPVPH